MIIVPEAACPALLSLDDAFAPVEQVFAAMARGDAANFPVVREAIGDAEDALYGFKGGFDRAGATLGLKAGGYWPHNLERGIIGNHQSTVFLFDPDTGRPTAMIGGNYLTAARTAASSAVSIKHLARQGRQGPRHDRRRPPGRLPAPRRPPPAPLRAGHRLEPPPRDAPPPRRGRQGSRPALRGRRPRPPRRRGRRHHLDHLVLRPDPEGGPGQARHPPRLHGHRHQGQAGGRGRAPRPRHRLHRRGRPVGDDRRGPARRRRGPDRRGRHHPDRRRHQRRPPRPHAPPTRSPSSTAPASASRTSPSPPGSSSSPGPPARRPRSRSDRRSRPTPRRALHSGPRGWQRILRPTAEALQPAPGLQRA